MFPFPLFATAFSGTSHRATHACALAFTLACASPAFAQASPDDQPPSTTWSLGFGAMTAQKPYTDIDRDNTVLPLLLFENRYVQIRGPQIGFKLPPLDLTASQRLQVSIVGKYDGHGYDEDDAPILNGMDKRKGSVWAGVEASWENDLVDVHASWLADVSGHSKGHAFRLGLQRTWHAAERLSLTPRVQATWHDKKSVDYYYGVRSHEVRSDRPAYAGTSGVSTEIGVRGVYQFNHRHSVFLDVAVSRLPNAIKDSPLVDRSTEHRVMMGYLYRFQ